MQAHDTCLLTHARLYTHAPMSVLTTHTYAQARTYTRAHIHTQVASEQEKASIRQHILLGLSSPSSKVSVYAGGYACAWTYH